MPELATRTSIIIDAARKSGLLAREGKATAGASGTIADTEYLVHATDNDLKGYEVYVHTGTGIDQDPRRASASTSSSSLMTVTPNFDTTPDSTSEYLVFVPSPVFVSRLIKDGIDAAIRRIRKRFLLSKTNMEYVAQDLLWGYGSMQRWTSGTSSAPDGMTLAGAGAAMARSTTLPNQMVYSGQLTSGGSAAASLSRSVTQYAQYNEMTVSFYGWIRANTASRVTLQVTDGVSTKTSDALTATNTWYEVGPGKDINLDALTISANPTELTVSLNISAGGAVVAIASDLRLILGGRSLQRYELPSTNGYGSELTSFQWIHSILVEDYPGSWTWRKDYSISPRHFKVVDEEGTRFLYILRTDITGLANRRLLIMGQEGPALITSNAGTTSIDSEYLSTYSAWYALRSLPEKTVSQRENMLELRSEWESIDRLIRAKPKAGSIPVEKT